MRGREVMIGAYFAVGQSRPITLFAGLNVLETPDLTMWVARELKFISEKYGLNLVFKASWDKANRSSIHSYRGPGLDAGLDMLRHVKTELDLPIVTDIHQCDQAAQVAEVADILQIPAFLCRQTDLLSAACRTGRPLLIKKMQMMAPRDTLNLVEKCRHLGQENVLLCERGTSFGYGNLVVDPLSFVHMRETGVPLVFDVTHALQEPGGLGHATNGRGQHTIPLALAGISQGLAGLFFECHPDPTQARCDGPCAIPLKAVDTLVERVSALDSLVKSWKDSGSFS